MSITPIITFKAGICDFDSNVDPPSIKAKPTPGYLYLFEEDELIHFCWRPRSASMSSPELELVMVPSDGRFLPYKDTGRSTETTTVSPTNGRIYILKFQSSTQRHFFWLQSKTQHWLGDASWFSRRDLKLGEIVDRLLQGDEVNAQEEFFNEFGDGNEGGDTEMQDTAPEGAGGSQGDTAAGDSTMPHDQQDTTGSHGGDAGNSRSSAVPTDDATAAVQNFLRSMQGSQALQSARGGRQGQLYTTLPDLLPTSTTIPFTDSASSTTVDRLLENIPPVLLLLSQQSEVDTCSTEASPEAAKAALEGMSLEQKKEVLRKVLRSPQFTQGLNSLTGALRDGGLPTISEALKIPVENGGLIQGGTVPQGGGDAVEVFVKGVKSSTDMDQNETAGNMDTD